MRTQKTVQEKNNREQDLKLLEKDLFTTDKLVRASTLKITIQDSDPIERSLGLASFLNFNKVMTGIIYQDSVNLPSEGIGVEISKIQFDLQMNQFKGEVKIEGQIGALEGSLQGTTLYGIAPTFKFKKKTDGGFFTISAQLNNNGVLKGEMTETVVKGYPDTIILDFFNNTYK